MNAPIVLVIAKLSGEMPSNIRIRGIAGAFPHVILDKRGKIETDMLKDYSLKINMKIFEAADRTLLHRKHNSSKIMRIMTESILKQAYHGGYDLLIANFIEKAKQDDMPPDISDAHTDELCGAIYDGLTDLGGICIFIISAPEGIYFLPAGTEMNLCAGSLSDVVPTLLDLIGLSKSDDMKGSSLILKSNSAK